MKIFLYSLLLSFALLFFTQRVSAAQSSEEPVKEQSNSVAVDSKERGDPSNSEELGKVPEVPCVSEEVTESKKSDTVTHELTPSGEAEPAAAVVPTDPSMIPPPNDQSAPEDPNAVSSSSSQDEESSIPVNSVESIEKKKEQIKVRYYQVRTQVEKNEALTSLRSKVDKATNNEEKRQLLRAYYELLFEKMKKLDPSIAERCDVMQAAYMRRLEKICIEPSVPLKPLPDVDRVSPNTIKTRSSLGN